MVLESAWEVDNDKTEASSMDQDVPPDRIPLNQKIGTVFTGKTAPIF